MKKGVRQDCELCKGEASVYCEADAAFLCWACDERVHGANFLVGRHVRTLACAGCLSFAAGTVTGAGFAPIYAICRSCDSVVPSTTTSCSTSCFSTAESASSAVVVAGKELRLKQRRRTKAIAEQEMNRCKDTIERRPARMAIRMLDEYGGSVAEVPIGVAMAAEVGSKKRKGGSVLACKRALRRLVAYEDVRARAILLADSNIARAGLRRRFAKEGWDECP